MTQAEVEVEQGAACGLQSRQRANSAVDAQALECRERGKLRGASLKGQRALYHGRGGTFLSEFTLPEFLHVTDLRLQILDFAGLSTVHCFLS